MTGHDPPKSRKAKQDESVMGTNNSSIVSKRSVERLYYAEPHFYRYFVKKPLRRSPLINRGYWLRMHAVELVIMQFLEQPSKKSKIILNLGCGYDPVAFQWLSKSSSLCQNVRFIDIDFPELIARKTDVIVNTPQLRELLGPHERLSNTHGVFLSSKHYVALGCDLGNIVRLGDLLGGEFDSSKSLILCTAEVSMTYMDVRATDALISWGARYEDIRFCLLEQYLPDGPKHPFAQKMIQHFKNLQTPLKNIDSYPGLRDQEQRFLRAGWPTATARSLWELWKDPAAVTPDQRLALNSVEPFDEWEEFILFASHYFLLTADRSSFSESHSISQPLRIETQPNATNELSNKSLTATFNILPKSNLRRFGALVQLSPNSVGHHGGLGTQSRINTMDTYDLSAYKSVNLPDITKMVPRMCHTITAFGDDSLLIGGRASPNEALQDCWLLHGNCWKRVEDLPIPLFRHCATGVLLGGDEYFLGVLVYGGKTRDNRVCDRWFLWQKHSGWAEAVAIEHKLRPRFGASTVSTGNCMGILSGGMEADGTILNEIWEWTLIMDDGPLTIRLKRCEVFGKLRRRTTVSRSTSEYNVVARLGACVYKSTMGILLIGGVASDILAQDHEVVCLSRKSSGTSEVDDWHCTTVDYQIGDNRPLLVGHSALTLEDSVFIVGGGAVCFSFGTYWNTSMMTLSANGTKLFVLSKRDHQKSDPTGEIAPMDYPKSQLKYAQPDSSYNDVTSIDKIRVQSPEDFRVVLDQRRPVVIGGLDLGLCVSAWSLESLKVKIGHDRTVVVHEATDAQMSFQQKNFEYKKKPFSVFVDEISEGSNQYLRSLAMENPSGQPANFWVDFPELASEFVLPTQLDVIRQNMHSSVLRVSGPVTMWLHYDVMANILCQINGSKRLILYPPSDVSLFSVPPGASSSSVNCFDTGPTQNPSLASAHPHEFLLEPGDVLFIPPLWLHTASPAGNVSISVNVFFRNLDFGYAPGRDVYGNRDVQAYEKGRRDIEKMTRSFNKLPADMARFYLERLADELHVKALTIDS